MTKPIETPPKGRIVTFYSYKGGTGRSMALANVAWLLAANGLKVLVIDWDLEAPGLHRYFHPFLEDKELSSTPGIIDYLVDLNMSARRAYARGTVADESRWFEPYTALLRYSRSLEFEFPGEGRIDFVCAGQQDPAYSERVTSFDWRDFYEALGGGVVLEALKQNLRAEYHYVLIDSRTGISDTSGICTVQMPDDLVVLFTLNRQSIRGASAAARSAFDQRRRPDGKPGLRIFPVRTRVERVEALRLRVAKDMAAAAFDELLWHIPREARQAYWGRVEVPHQPFYAHEEVLAAFGDGESESGSMLAAMQVIAGLIANEQAARKPELSESDRKEYLGRYLPELAFMATPQPLPSITPALATERNPSASLVADSYGSRSGSPDAYEEWGFVSYASNDNDPYLVRFIEDLTAQMRVLLGASESIFFDRRAVQANNEWPRVIEAAISRCRVGVCLYSPGYFVSEDCGREFAMLIKRMKPGGSGVIPVNWSPVPGDLMNKAAASIQIYAAPDGLRSLARRHRSHQYANAIVGLAERIANIGRNGPLTLLPFAALHSTVSAFRQRESDARKS